MKNTFLKVATILVSLLLSISINAAEIQIFTTNFSTLEPLSQSSGSTPVVSSDGNYEVVRGAITPSGGSCPFAPNTSFFLTSSSAGLITFNNLILNNGGRIVIKWGSASSRPLHVNSGKTNTNPGNIGDHPNLSGAERSTIITENYTIPASITGNTSITIGSGGGGGVYVFEVTVFTNSSGPIIDAFTLAGVSGSINTLTGAIAVTVPFSTNLTSLTPIFTLAPGTTFVVPAEQFAAKNFSVPVSYNMTDGTDTKLYTVTVTKAPASTACNILTFSIPEQIAAPEFKTGVKDSIIVTVPFSTTPAQIAALVPTYTPSPLVSSALPATGVAQNFTTPVTYTIIAEDVLVSKQYVVRVQKAPASNACSITNFSMGFAKEIVDINQFTGAITVRVDDSETLTGVTPIITKSDLSSIFPVGAQNFIAPIIYTVTAEDGVTNKVYTVTVIPDGIAPALLSSSPVHDPTFSNAIVSLAGIITLTYNEDVVAGAGAVSISGGGILGSPSYIGKTVQIPFSGLTSLTNYTLTIPAGVFTDYFGNPVGVESIAFRTADGENKVFPYASHMDGVSFAQPAFISGGTYSATADSKATTTTQYGAYVLTPAQKLTITTTKVGTILANVYAPGENRNFTITNNQNANVTNGNITSYDNNGTEISQVIDSNVVTEIYITNTGSGNIYVPYIYISDVSQPAVDEKTQWCN